MLPQNPFPIQFRQNHQALIGTHPKTVRLRNGQIVDRPGKFGNPFVPGSGGTVGGIGKTPGGGEPERITRSNHVVHPVVGEEGSLGQSFEAMAILAGNTIIHQTGEKPAAILEKGGDIIALESLLMSVNLPVLSVEAGQATVSTHPQKTTLVLDHLQHLGLGHAVFNIVALQVNPLGTQGLNEPPTHCKAERRKGEDTPPPHPEKSNDGQSNTPNRR